MSRLFWTGFLPALLLSLTLFNPANAQQAPDNFERAKLLLRQHVYHDRERSELGDFYCGCNWAFYKRNASGGKTDLASCGYQVRAQQNRAERIEWEHIMPAHSFGQQRQCWQKGGRKNCVANDPVFSKMEADMHNLTVSVGEVNADRSNYRFSVLPGTEKQYGKCDVKIDFKQRAAEPRDEVKGMAARTYFYMHDRYNLRMSEQQSRLFMAWDKQFPPSAWESERNRRIAKIMGYDNPFVSGTKSWSLKGAVPQGTPSSDTVVMQPVEGADFLMYPRAARQTEQRTPQIIHAEQPVHIAPIIGNSNSMIYHMPDCPSYSKVSEQNKVIFHLEQHAIGAGFRKAKNCP